MSHEPTSRSLATSNPARHPPGTLGFAVMTVAVTPLLRWLVIRLAVPPGRPARTCCDQCGAEASPIGSGWSALLPGGRCSQCRHRIGAPAYLLELLTIAAAIVVVLAAPTVPVMLAGLWWAGCAIPLLFIDVRVHRLPDVLTLPAAGGVLTPLAVEAALTGRWGAVLNAVAAGGVAGAVFLLMALLLGNRGTGLGDAKLVVSVTALLGWWGIGSAFAAVFLGFLAAGLTGLMLLATGRANRHTHIPMGPFFIGAGLAIVALLPVVGSHSPWHIHICAAIWPAHMPQGSERTAWAPMPTVALNCSLTYLRNAKIEARQPA